MIIAILSSWAGLADSLFFIAFLTLAAAAACWRVLRGHQRTIDAQRFQPGGLTHIISRHLPPALRTNVASEEIPLVKQAIERKVRLCRHLVLSSAGIAIVLAPAAGFITWRQIEKAQARAITAQLPPEVDVLSAAGGTWGWKYGVLQSCDKNPHTIVLSDGHRKLSIRYKEPTWAGSREITGYEGTVIGIRRNELVVSLLDAQTTIDRTGKPVEWTFVFKDQNTYYVRRSDAPTTSTGDIGRCPDRSAK
jgi:hypothetical protein